MIFDEIFLYIGDLGRGQIIQYFLLCWPFFIAGILSVDVVFLMAVPKFICNPGNLTLSILKTSLNVSTNHQVADQLINLLTAAGQIRNRCYQWNEQHNLSDYIIKSFNNTFSPNVTFTSNETCNNFIYSEQSFGKTIPNEYNLVCDYSYVRDNLKTIFFVGRILGAILFGQLSDLIGRLTTFLIVVICNVGVGLGLFFSSSTIMFGIFIFLQGIIQVGYTLTIFVLGCEQVGVSKRKWTGTINQFFYTCAFIFIPLCYLGVWSWRYLALISGVPSVIFLSYFFCVNESPRWLIIKGCTKKALKILNNLAKQNKKSIPDDVQNSILQHKESKEYQKSIGKTFSIIDLLNTKRMFILTINTCFNWVVNALIYYGIIFNTENLGGSLYINFILMGLVEIPAYILNLMLLDRIGRKKLQMATLWLTGISCLITGFIPKRHWIAISTVAMIGKFTVTMSYGVIYIFTTEIFNTNVRNVAMGTGSMSARIGSMLSIPILSLHQVYTALPMIVFFVLAVTAGIFTIFLPETRGLNLDVGSQNELTGKNTSDQNQETNPLQNENV